MRSLTIRRNKSFVGCAIKLKVYIQDETEGELLIGGVMCRKLGDLKNGEEKTFSIHEREARVYVIADKLSKDFCADYVTVPAGNEDVFLSGKNHYNPVAGNPFWFDGVTDEVVLANRKKNKGRSGIVMIAAVLVGLVLGLISSGVLFGPSGDPKTFTEAGLSITLTDQFSVAQDEEFTACFESDEVAVYVLREGFELMEGLEDYTLDQYAELVLASNGMALSELLTEGDIPYFTFDYTDDESGDTVFYHAYMYKGPDGFWLIQFAAMLEQQEKYAPQFGQWAQTVSFTE